MSDAPILQIRNLHAKVAEEGTEILHGLDLEIFPGKIHAVMGGFHLGGADPAAVVGPTIEGLIKADPAYVIPTHCTGRKEIMEIERRMPGKFLLNMAGTKMTFSA